MTPFGEQVRRLRKERGAKLIDMAQHLDVSSAYLSALEHGHRGPVNRRFVHRVCQYFDLAWEDADQLQELADYSDPKVALNTAGLTPFHTELANRFALMIRDLDRQTARAWNENLKAYKKRDSGETSNPLDGSITDPEKK